MEKKYVVDCLSCGKIVVVTLEEYETWHSALCPVCGKLAYNSKQLPEREEK